MFTPFGLKPFGLRTAFWAWTKLTSLVRQHFYLPHLAETFVHLWTLHTTFWGHQGINSGKPVALGFELMTFRSIAKRLNHWATTAQRYYTEKAFECWTDPTTWNKPNVLCILGCRWHFPVDLSCEAQTGPKDRVEVLQKCHVYWGFEWKSKK